jgi:hypothetical protein
LAQNDQILTGTPFKNWSPCQQNDVRNVEVARRSTFDVVYIIFAAAASAAAAAAAGVLTRPSPRWTLLRSENNTIEEQ